MTNCDEVLRMQNLVHDIHVAPELGRYIVDIVRATREHPQMQVGASPRGALGLFRLAQSLAYMQGRDHVRPEDIQRCAVPVLAHRITLETKAKYAGVAKQSIIQEVLQKIRVPR